jgi:hypothetical protein
MQRLRANATDRRHKGATARMTVNKNHIVRAACTVRAGTGISHDLSTRAKAPT